MSQAVCQGCGRLLRPPQTKWCSEACRKKRAERLTNQNPSPRESVDIDKALRDTRDFLLRYVRFSSEAAPTTLALWIAHTHAFDAAYVTPYLQVTSPEKRSGKTRVLEVLELLVPDPLRVVSISEAALFRKVAQGRVTLLFDEVDEVFDKRDRSTRNEGLRALLNAGYREGAKVARCVGSGRRISIVEYSAFCPKALASIGSLPDTVADRSITIRMERKTSEERVSRFRFRVAQMDAEPIRESFGAWASRENTIQELRSAEPDVPEELDDRAAEGWEALIAIADMAGGSWPQQARRAAVELQTERVIAEVESYRILLLRHILEAFAESGSAIPATTLLDALTARDDGPWAKWWGRSLRVGNYQGPASELASMLAAFRIYPRDINSSSLYSRSVRGYDAAGFVEAWTRYLPPEVLRERIGQAVVGP